jgi:hypothetical protein
MIAMARVARLKSYKSEFFNENSEKFGIFFIPFRKKFGKQLFDV